MRPNIAGGRILCLCGFHASGVPDRSICLAMTDSLRSRKYLYKRTIRNANAFDFVNIIDSVIARVL